MHIREISSDDMEEVSNLVCNTLDSIHWKIDNNKWVQHLKSYYSTKHLKTKYQTSSYEKWFIIVWRTKIIWYWNLNIQKKEIWSLYIQHTLLNKWYWSLLLEHLERYAAKNYINEIFVDSTKEFHYFYKKRWYIIIKKINVENNEWVDSIWMKKNIR